MARGLCASSGTPSSNSMPAGPWSSPISRLSALSPPASACSREGDSPSSPAISSAVGGFGARFSIARPALVIVIDARRRSSRDVSRFTNPPSSKRSTTAATEDRSVIVDSASSESEAESVAASARNTKSCAALTPDEVWV